MPTAKIDDIELYYEVDGDGDWLIGGERTTGDFSWYDGTPFAFTRWASGEPGPDGCLQLRDGFFDAMACSDAEDWICEVL